MMGFFCLPVNWNETSSGGLWLESLKFPFLKLPFFFPTEEERHCAAPEPPQNVKQATTRPPTTSALTTFRTSTITSTSHAMTKTTDLTPMERETVPEYVHQPRCWNLDPPFKAWVHFKPHLRSSFFREIYVTEWFTPKVWSMARWIIFTGMCLYLSCFITCVEIWFRMHRIHWMSYAKL